MNLPIREGSFNNIYFGEKMKYKLISTDLDGTLLNSNESISIQNSVAMKTLRDMGITIAVNTGRTLFEIPDSVRANPYIDYYICSNGAAIYDSKKRLVYGKYIDPDTFKTVFNLISGYSTSFAIHQDGISVLDKNKATVEYWMEHRANEYAARNFIKFSEFANNFNSRYSNGAKSVEMICCYFKFADELSECTQKLKQMPLINTAASTTVNIEIFNSEVDKGITMLTLCDILGIEKDAVIAAGDSNNDLSMLEKAELSLATSNAMESVKSAADAVICTCDEHIMEDIARIISERDNG